MSGLPSRVKSARAKLRGAVAPAPVPNVAAVPKTPVTEPRSTETLLAPEFAVTRSRCPSPLRSPVATAQGAAPVVPVPNPYGAGGPSVPSPMPMSTFRSPEPMLTVATSRKPSLLKSPIASPIGPLPTVLVSAGSKVASPRPSRTATLLPAEFAMIRSSLPSLFMSPVARNTGAPSVPASVWNRPLSVRAPLVLPVHITTMPAAGSTVAASGLPSPLKSPRATLS